MNRSFKSFLFEKRQITTFCLFLAVALVIAVLMRVFYPYPLIHYDSHTYLVSTVKDQFNVYRPMGYSYYLRLLHFFSDSIELIFYVTYFLIFLSSVLFLFSAGYLLGIKNDWLFILSGLLLLTDSRLILSSNLIMSDGIFTALSLLFFTVQLWLVKRPSFIMVIINLVLLYLMCKIRYSGLFCIPVSVVILLISFRGKKPIIRIPVSCLPILFGILFYWSVKSEYERNTGVDTFSGFGGWQLVNNASVLFPEAKSLPLSEFATDDLKTLHKYMSSRPDKVFDSKFTFHNDYMWSLRSPYTLFNGISVTRENHWPAMGKIYGEYAKVLIRNYPVKYLTEFIIPSFCSNFKFQDFSDCNIFFFHDLEYDGYYDISAERDAFYKKHRCEFFKKIQPVRKVLHTVLWSIFGTAVIALFFLGLKKERRNSLFTQCTILLLMVFIILCGLVLSSPNTTFRYTMPIFGPMVVFMAGVIQQLLNYIKTDNQTASKTQTATA